MSEAPNPSESAGSPEYGIDELPARLGVVKSAEIIQAEAAVLELARGEYSPEQLVELMISHREKLVAIVEALQGDEYQRAQLGLLIVVANLKRDLGLLVDYLVDLDDAWTMAYYQGDDVAMLVLDSEMKKYAEKVLFDDADPEPGFQPDLTENE